MEHKVLVCGLGKLGLCLASKLALKREVLGYDISNQLVDALNSSSFSTPETGLNQLIHANASRLKFFSDTSSLPSDELLVFIIVPTPSLPDASFDTKYVYQLIDTLLPWLRTKDTPTHLVLVSTVMPGATQKIKDYIYDSLGESLSKAVSVTYNPEFIALGSVLHDMEYPDLLLLGTSPEPTPIDKRALQLIIDSYAYIHKSDPEHHILSYSEAELAKLSINTYLTQKISFANNLMMLAGSLPHSSASAILNAVGADTRVGKKYLKPGLGFGGPCLPRDTRAFSRLSDELNLPAWMPLSVQKTDRATYTFHAARISSLVHNNDISEIIFDGVTYKPDSWLLDDSPTLQLIEEVRLHLGDRVTYSYSDAFESTIASPLRSTHPYLHPYVSNSLSRKALIVRCHPGPFHTDYVSLDSPIIYSPTDSNYIPTHVIPADSQVRTLRRISLPPAVSGSFRSLYKAVLDESHIKDPEIMLSKESDQQTHLHHLVHSMYDNNPHFLDSYIKVIKHALLAIDDQAVPDHILVQRFPTFRVQFPDNISVYQFHKDSQYNHSPSELNHLFYLTQSYGSSSLHIESQYSKPFQKYSDYRDLSFGEHDLIQLNTSKYWHGDLPNLSGNTRYSIDFRFLLNPNVATGLPTHSGTRHFTDSSYYRTFNTRTLEFDGP